MDDTNTAVLAERARCKAIVMDELDALENRVYAHVVAPLEQRIAELTAERDRLRDALNTLPMGEFGDALANGCDANGAWDCVYEAINKHVAAALSGAPAQAAAHDARIRARKEQP